MLNLSKIQEIALTSVNENVLLRNAETEHAYPCPKGIMDYVRRYALRYNCSYGWLCFVDSDFKEYIVKLPSDADKIREVITILEVCGYERECGLIVPFSQPTEQPYPGTTTYKKWRKADINRIA